jgi:hypothetical protein
MSQQSTTSTFTHWCVNSLQQVHIEQHEPLKHGVNACDSKEEAFPSPLTVPLCYKPGNKSSSRIRCDSTVYIKYIYLLIRLNSLYYTHWSVNTVYIIPPDPSTQSTSNLLIQHSLHHTYWSTNTVYIILTDLLTQSTSYFLMGQHSIQQVHILTDAPKQSTTSTYTYWCVNKIYNKYISLLMRQHSRHQVYIEQHEPLRHGVHACDSKEESFPAPLTVPLC